MQAALENRRAGNEAVDHVLLPSTAGFSQFVVYASRIPGVRMFGFMFCLLSLRGFEHVNSSLKAPIYKMKSV